MSLSETEVAEVAGGRPLGRLFLKQAKLRELLGYVANAVGQASAAVVQVIAARGTRCALSLQVRLLGLRLQAGKVAPYSSRQLQFALKEKIILFTTFCTRYFLHCLTPRTHLMIGRLIADLGLILMIVDR